MPNYWVVPASSGRWIAKLEGAPASEASAPSSYDEAVGHAAAQLEQSGGGILIVVDATGQTSEQRIAQTGLRSAPLAPLPNAFAPARRRQRTLGAIEPSTKAAA